MTETKKWTRSDVLALASGKCARCYGLGYYFGRSARMLPCGCVLRKIFTLCYQRFIACTSSELAWFKVTQEPGSGETWGLKREEYAADFCAVARRALGADTLAERVFKYHYLLGADSILCCRKLEIERGAFFHEVYRVQQKLGMAFRNTEPFALWPLDAYFSPRTRGAARRRPIGASAA